MNIKWLATLILAIGVGFTAGCNGNNAAPADPNAGVSENDISPVQDSKEAASVKQTITFFYADKELLGMHRIKQEVEAATKEELPLAALKLWMQGPDHDNLHNLVPPGVVIESLTFEDNLATVSFSRELKNANFGSTGELYLLDQIAQLMNQFGYSETQILIEGQMEESLFGHVSTNIPIEPTDPEQYEWLEE